MKFTGLTKLWNNLSDWNNQVYSNHDLKQVIDHLEHQGFKPTPNAKHPAAFVSELSCMVLESKTQGTVEIYLKNDDGQNNLSKDVGVYKVGHIEFSNPHLINNTKKECTSVSEWANEIKTRPATQKTALRTPKR